MKIGEDEFTIIIFISQVEKVIKHPRYSQTNFDNDIALVKLTKPVTFEGVLNPVCMPTPGEWYTGKNVSF